MTKSLSNRIMAYAVAHRADSKWKRPMYALLYGCNSLVKLNSIR